VNIQHSVYVLICVRLTLKNFKHKSAAVSNSTTGFIDWQHRHIVHRTTSN